MKKHIISSSLFLCMGTAVFAQNITLLQAKENTTNHNNTIKKSTLEIEEANALIKEARTGYLPKVSALAFGMKAIDPLIKLDMEGGNLPVYDGNPANLGSATQFAYMPGINISALNQLAGAAVTAMQPVYAGNRIKTGNKLADLNLEVKEKQKELSQREVILKTENEYWQTVKLYEKEGTLKAYEDFLDKLSKEVANAVKNGVTIKNDLLKVQVKRSELKLKRTQLENGTILSTKQLCQTMGIPYTSDLIPIDRVTRISPPDTYFISDDQALSQRIEYTLLEKSIEASKLQTELKKGEGRPSVNVGISGFYMDPLTKSMDGSFNGMVFAGVSVPVSNWWEDKHKINQMKAKEKIAENELKDNSSLLSLQIEKAWRDLNEAYKSISLNEEILEQAIENRRVNQQSYKNGLSQMSDLLEAQAQVNDTEERLIESKVTYQIAVAHYLMVTGR